MCVWTLAAPSEGQEVDKLFNLKFEYQQELRWQHLGGRGGGGEVEEGRREGGEKEEGEGKRGRGGEEGGRREGGGQERKRREGGEEDFFLQLKMKLRISLCAFNPPPPSRVMWRFFRSLQFCLV